MAPRIALRQPMGSNPDLFLDQPETSKLLATLDHRLGYGLAERSPLTLVGLHLDTRGLFEGMPVEAQRRFQARLLDRLTRVLRGQDARHLSEDLFWLPPYYLVVLPETDPFQCLMPIRRLASVLQAELAALLGPGRPYRIAIGSTTVRSGMPGVSNTSTVARMLESLMMAMAGQGVPIAAGETSDLSGEVRLYQYPWDQTAAEQKPARRPEPMAPRGSHPRQSFKRERPKGWWRPGK